MSKLALNKTLYIWLVAICISVLPACNDALNIDSLEPVQDEGSLDSPISKNETPSRSLLVYSAAYSNLSEALKGDIDDICRNYVPHQASKNNLLIYARTRENKDEPCLIRVSRSKENTVHRDTVMTWPGAVSTDINTFINVLAYVKENYPSAEYGLLFSSHGSGWLPPGMGVNSTSWVPSSGSSIRPRALGQELYTTEMLDIKDFAAAIEDSGLPMKYVILDVCYGGCIEIAYELKDACDYLVASPEEIWEDGMVYYNIVNRLLNEYPSNLVGVADDFYHHYNDNFTGIYQTGLISVTDCSKLEALASVCSGIFNEKRGAIYSLEKSNVQTLSNHSAVLSPYFFDFRDILANLDLSETQEAELDAALQDCIIYEAHTENAFGTPIRTCCGLAMYLPSSRILTNTTTRHNLNRYYLEYKWCRDSGYITEESAEW